MGSTSDDEQLAKAIALSLENEADYEAQLDRQQQELEDVKLAIALSLGKTVDQLTARDMLQMELPHTSSSSAPASDSDASSRKRLRPQDPVASHLSSTSKNQRMHDQFWDGVIKLTHVRGFVGPTFIKVEDIIQKSRLKRALLTAFVYSMDFINEQFPSDISLVLVTHGRPAMKGVLDSSGKRVVIQPPLHNERYGCFHPKLMLLFYEGSMRVVIGSANLEPYDYNELDNVVFIQDFPERPSTDPPCGINDLPQFARDIADLLDRMQVPRSVKQTLAKYDFSKAKAKIVASVSGVFEGDDDYKKFGHPRLATVIEQIGAADPLRPPRVEMQTSSLGAMTVQYLNELYTSFSGRDPYDNPAMRKMYKKPTSLPPINIVFPTWQTVERSKLGPPGAGTIFLSSEHWAKPTFPKSVMCDAISHRSGTLMHTKYIIATLKESKTPTSSTDQTIQGWIYIGSHNATAAAWGRLTLSKEKLPKLTMSNWELGVVLPMDKNSEYPSPYVRPAPKYRSDQQPWLQDLYHGFS